MPRSTDNCGMEQSPTGAGQRPEVCPEALADGLRMIASMRGIPDASTSPMEQRQAEDDLRRLTRHARCCLWKGTITGLPGWDTPQALEAGAELIRWENKFFDEDAAHAVIDIEQRPSERFEDVWCRGRPPEDQYRMACTTLAALQRGDETYEHQFRCRDRHGQVQWLYESVRIVPLEPGRWQAFGAVVNITAQKQAEEALRESEERYRLLFSRSPDGIFTVDPTGRFVLANPACELVSGYSIDELLQKTFMELCAPDELAEAVSAFQHSIMERACLELETAMVRKDGRRVDLWVVGEPVVSADNVVAVHCTVKDITRRRLAQEELRRAKIAAEAANHAKDQFIAMLSHELRTPLTPALAAVSILEGDARLPADVREDLAMIRRNIGLEVRLIADLLDVSRIISGKLLMERRPTDVAAAINEAARIVRGDLEARNQRLSIETPGTPYLTLADPARLQQVFWNLLRNAIKFTPPYGWIAIRASLEEVDRCPFAAESCPVGMGDCPLPPAKSNAVQPCEGNLVVTVSDSGKGITPEVLPHLFEAFTQAQDTRGMGGLGLGLAICKAVVDMHGGSITAHSDGPGTGAAFSVRLPVAQCPMRRVPVSPQVPPVQVATPEHGDRPLRIVLVEDSRDTALAMQRLLRSRGHVVSLAGDVSGALEAVTTQKPDLLICDIGLPDGSGIDLVRQIRTAGNGLPAIALSGYGQEHDIQQSREAGFAIHLTKPIDPIRLYEAIATTSAGKGAK